MNKNIEFLKECKVFWLNTVSNNVPKSRPFGAISYDGMYIYIATSNQKNVYNEMILNPNVMITAIKHNTRTWIRISGQVTLETDIDKKLLLFNDNPILYERYDSLLDPKLAVFRLNIEEVTLN